MVVKEMLKRKISVCLNEILFQILRIKAKRNKYIDSNNVFILRFAHIGDFCVWLDSAQAYRKLYPGKKIIFITYAYKNVMELAKGTGYFDKVISLETEGFKRIKALKEASRFMGDLIINANPSRSLLSDLFVLAVNVNRRIAQQSDFSEMTERLLYRSDKVYDEVIACDLKSMELIKNAEFIRGLGLKDFKARLFHIPDIPCEIAVPEDDYAVVFPDADAKIQMWDYRNYTEVILRLNEKYGFRSLLMGSGKYEAVGEHIQNLLPKSICVNIMGKTTLTECIKLVRHAKIVISNDTGGAHIAAGVGTPCVVLAAGWNRGRFFPYRVEEKDDRECMPVDLVAEVDCLGCGIETIDRYVPACGIDGIPKCISANTPDKVWKIINEVVGQKDGNER